jgi:hypothetical protein
MQNGMMTVQVKSSNVSTARHTARCLVSGFGTTAWTRHVDQQLMTSKIADKSFTHRRGTSVLDV